MIIEIQIKIIINQLNLLFLLNIYVIVRINKNINSKSKIIIIFFTVFIKCLVWHKTIYIIIKNRLKKKVKTFTLTSLR